MADSGLDFMAPDLWHGGQPVHGQESEWDAYGCAGMQRTAHSGRFAPDAQGGSYAGAVRPALPAPAGADADINAEADDWLVATLRDAAGSEYARLHERLHDYLQWQRDAGPAVATPLWGGEPDRQAHASGDGGFFGGIPAHSWLLVLASLPADEMWDAFASIGQGPEILCSLREQALSILRGVSLDPDRAARLPLDELPNEALAALLHLGRCRHELARRVRMGFARGFDLENFQRQLDWALHRA